jgi:hypothetical protein
VTARTANIGNIGAQAVRGISTRSMSGGHASMLIEHQCRAQPVRGHGEDECHPQPCRGTAEDECRARPVRWISTRSMSRGTDKFDNFALGEFLRRLAKANEVEEMHDPPISLTRARDCVRFVNFAARARSAKSKRIAECSHHYKSCVRANKDSSSHAASTQRKEVIRCLMVQQGGRRGVFLYPRADRTAVTFGR